jgi:release factor glutamine methyltransferase
VEIASENAILNRVADTLRFVVGDGVGFLRRADTRQATPETESEGRMGQGGAGGFDIVVCNPPYVATAEIAGLEPEVRDHDPAAALDGGIDGTEFIDGIVPQLTSIVADGGIVALEIGSTQAEAVCSIFRKSGLGSIEVLKDLAGLDRVIIGRVV